MTLAKAVALRSKDPNTKIGCVIVGPANEIRSTGYNSFPRGINDNVPERLERPEKYFWVEHAERNAVFNAARCGTSLEGCTIYVPWYPCIECARAIVQAGIKKVVCYEIGTENPQKWAESFMRSQVLLTEAGIEVEHVRE